MHLLFDLDGTLADSFPGISRSINRTLAVLEREAVPEERLRRFVGLRLTTIFGDLLCDGDPALVDRAVAIYRPLFDEEGLAHSRVFPEIPDALATLRAAGHGMQVVTVRSISSARLVVRHLGLDPYFDAVPAPGRARLRRADGVRPPRLDRPRGSAMSTIQPCVAPSRPSPISSPRQPPTRSAPPHFSSSGS